MHNKDLIENQVAQAANGDEKAQQVLYERLSPVLFSVCMRYMGNKQDAEDVFQEGFIKIFGALDSYRGDGSFDGWARRVMVNVALGNLRKRRPDTDEELDDSPNFAYDATVLERMSANELMVLVTELPEKYRSVFNMFAIEGYSHQEIAEMTGISEGNSKLRMNRARKMLQEKVQLMTQVA